MRGTLTAATLMAATLFAADLAREKTLQRAIDLMESKGDLAKAMPLLDDAARSTDKALAARALLYLGQAQERQGAERARATYQRIIAEFGGETATVAAARRRLAGLGVAHLSAALTKRLVCGECDAFTDVSPDGRFMLMTHWDTGDVMVRETSTSQVKRLLAKPGSWQDSDDYAEFPLFSPDLRRIAYTWFTDDSKGPGHAELRVMDNEPGTKARVLVNTPENTYYEPVDWSRDGKSILVLIERPDLTWQLAWVSASDGSVKVLKSLEWRIRWGGRQARSLPNGHSRARISPDGRYIAYAALAVNPKAAKGPIEITDHHIYVLAADGSSEVEVVKTAGVNENPVWTPDGKHLLFTSDRSGNSDLWSIAIDNGKAAGLPRLAMSGPGTGTLALGMTRSGSYFYTNRNLSLQAIGIAELGTSAGAAGRLVGIRPSWSPDGRQLAFMRPRPSTRGNNFDLIIHSLQTGEETLHSFNGLGPAAPRWFHDAKSVLVVVQNPGKTRSWFLFDLANKEFKHVFEFDPSLLAGGILALSRDDQTIYMPGRIDGVQMDRIVAVDLKSGRQKPVCTLPVSNFVSSLQLSPDGRTLAFLRRESQSNKTSLARVGIDGSNYREIHSFTEGGAQLDHVAWDKDGKTILFARRKDEEWTIMRIPAEGGTPETSGFDHGKVTGLQNISLSPDGKRLAFSANQRIHELWAVDNLLSVLK